ncbi:MAG: hypothetical protein HC881_04070 [Leptolyngbyaceae cyanobacterium SL_7_1]|nr:hypothetical protein [Leptolyngbyaceae cyanobacterium SL_7_1]
MTQIHQVKPSTDASPVAPPEAQLQRRAFPHEVEPNPESKSSAIASPTPISRDWQAQQEKWCVPALILG